MYVIEYENFKTVTEIFIFMHISAVFMWQIVLYQALKKGIVTVPLPNKVLWRFHCQKRYSDGSTAKQGIVTVPLPNKV